MDVEFAQQLCDLNTRFYAENSASFAATRHASWEGWHRLSDDIRTCLLPQGIQTTQTAATQVGAQSAVMQVGVQSAVMQAGTRTTATEAKNQSLRVTDVACGHQALRIANAACANQNLRVTDVACGNLRFESYLMHEFPDVAFDIAAFDNCDDLLPGDMPTAPGISTTFHHCDAMEALRFNTLESLLCYNTLESSLPCDASELSLCDSAPESDLSVAFGFMHHVPLPLWRERVVQALISATRVGGLVALSLWRFMDNEAMAHKARKTHEEALDVLGWRACAHQFSSHDVLMGWQNTPGAYRYCHSFTTQEIDALLDAVSDRADLVARFRADGRTHNLNEYIVLQVKAH